MDENPDKNIKRFEKAEFEEIYKQLSLIDKLVLSWHLLKARILERLKNTQ